MQRKLGLQSLKKHLLCLLRIYGSRCKRICLTDFTCTGHPQHVSLNCLSGSVAAFFSEEEILWLESGSRLLPNGMQKALCYLCLGLVPVLHFNFDAVMVQPVLK